MLHVNDKTLTHMVNYEKMIFDKRKIQKCDMTSVNLEKTLTYLKIQETLSPENLTKYYANIVVCFSLPRNTLHKRIKQITELARTL